MEPRTLEAVLATVDTTVLRPAATPRGTAGVRVGDVAILDWTDPDSLGAGSLVLAVGVEPDRPAAATLVDRAAGAGVAAIVVRGDGELPDTLAAAAERAGVAVLTAPAGVAWGQLYALLRTALASAGPGETGASGTAVGDLFALADAIAAAVGGPVTIEDPQSRVLTYSNLDQEIDEARRHTILGRTPPPEWQVRLEEAGVGRALRQGDGIVRFEAEGLAPRLAAPIRAGGELLGSVWLAVSDRPLAADAEDQLLRAAELSAMHLIAHRASEDVKRRARGASVREILEGRAPGGHRPPPAPLCVIAFEALPEDQAGWRSGAERILSVVSLFAEAAHPEAMCALVDERIWALVPTGARERAVDLAERVVARVEDVLGVRVHAAIGPSVSGLRTVPDSRAAAERALAVIERRPETGRVVHVDDVRGAAILEELLELSSNRPSLRRGPLADLDEAAAAQLTTLRAYLDAHGDVGAAASRLAVHPNTLRYRLRRLVETTGLDLDDPDERLVTEFQLRLLERNGAVADD